MLLQQCHPNSAGSLVIAGRTELNPHCFCLFLLCCRLPPKQGETAKVYRIEIDRSVAHLWPLTFNCFFFFFFLSFLAFFLVWFLNCFFINIFLYIYFSLLLLIFFLLFFLLCDFSFRLYVINSIVIHYNSIRKNWRDVP